MKRIFLCAGLALLFGYGCAGVPARPVNVSAEILDYGIYNEKVLKVIEDENMPGGTRGDVRYSLVAKTERIPARLGLSFGFRYTLRGVSEKSPLKIRRIFLFPEEGLTDTEKGKTYYKAQLDDELTVREKMEIGYKFEHSWELVPGTWAFQVWYEGKKLAEKTFNVYKDST